MSVGRRLAAFSGMRIDLSHLRSIESAVSSDFDSVLRGLFTGLNQPYLVRGFDIVIPSAAINASALQITVADSVVLHSSATESGTIMQVPTTYPVETLNAQNIRVTGSFQANSLNYVSLDYRRKTDTLTVDQTSGWSPSEQLEFQRTAPIGRILDYNFIISTTGFSTNLPLYIVKTSVTGAVQYITKSVPDLFRLGSGGANPNALHSYNWGNTINSQPGANARREWINTNLTLNANSLTVEPGAPALAFQYGDFAVKNMKSWMDAIMTRIKEMSNSEYWYLDTNVPGGPPGPTSDQLNLHDVWFDSVGSVQTGAGTISYNLVLESTLPSDGAFQSPLSDPSAGVGDIYVQGQTSFTKATVTSFNAGRVIVNSLTSAAFIYNESLLMHRTFHPNLGKWVTFDYPRNSNRYGSFQRQTSSLAPLALNVATWSYVNINGPTATNGWSIVTVSTNTPHGLNIGQFARIEGLIGVATHVPNGVHRIISVPSSTSITIISDALQTGAATVSGSNTCVLDTNEHHPYSPDLLITAFVPTTGTLAKVTVPNHNYLPAQSLTGNFAVTSNLISNINNMTNLRIGMKVYSVNFTGGFAYILGINVGLSQVEVSSNSLNTATAQAFTAKQIVFLNGLQATGFTYNQINGAFDIVSLSLQGDIIVDLGVTVTTTSLAVNARADLLYHAFNLSITAAQPNAFNVSNTSALAIAGDKVQFLIGLDTLPLLGNAAGSYILDGVVAHSIVRDPVRVSTITNDGAGNLTVNTFVPHGLSSTGTVTFTLYGNPDLSQYIRSYTNVTIGYVSANVFTISGTGIISVASYTNPGNDNTFVNFSDNPYAGPIQWSSDIVIKGIIGDLSFTIPQTAIVDISDPNVSPVANQFNVNGVTGTAYLRDKEVLFIKLERNKTVSSGTIFSDAGGGSVIVTASIMTDFNGGALVPGDYLKFSDEDDSKWIKIKTINATTVVLESDSNQDPDIVQRPAKSGSMVYCKGSYPLVYVKKHYLVDVSGSTYWLAIRRDNAGMTSKAYFRDMEISAGEVRQINDPITNNLLTYTGAMTEGAVNPNYSYSDPTGDFRHSQDLVIESVDNLTRQVTFTSSPVRGFQNRDQLVYNDGSMLHYFNVNFPLSTKTVILDEDTAVLAASNTVTLNSLDQFIQDQDNLTLAMRKEDRQAGAVDTAMKRPIYDESIFIQQINLSGAGTVRSGSYIYKGTLINPTALAWVVHGNAIVTETIESSSITMPGGHSTIGSNAILVNLVLGTFNDGDGLYQNGVSTGRLVNNPSNPPFAAPSVAGGVGIGVELVLPPNKRTQITGSGIVAYGAHSIYKQSSNPNLTGEELLVIVNDGIREAIQDYTETFGGPKAKIKLVRSVPPNTRIRFRALTAFGSVLAAKPTGVSLQTAYNSGATIDLIPGTPVEITASNVNGGEVAEIVRGSIAINGGVSQLGGIFNESGDQGFVIGSESNKPKQAWTGLEALKTHSSHPGSAVMRFTAAQVITGAAGTLVASSVLTLTDNYAYRIKINATARRSDGPLGIASFTMEGTFYALAGVAIAAGSPISSINGADGGGTSYAIAFGLSGNQVIAVSYGESGATVQWVLEIESQAVGVA